MEVLQPIQMLGVNRLKKNKFKQLYHQISYIGIDWKAFNDDQIGIRFVDSFEDLGQLRTVWATPKSTKYYGDRYKIKDLPKRRASTIKFDFKKQDLFIFRTGAIKVGDEYMLFDGNHRCNWIYHNKVKFLLILDYIDTTDAKPVTFDQLMIRK